MLKRMKELRVLATIEMMKIFNGGPCDLKKCKDITKELGELTRELNNQTKNMIKGAKR